jgi:N4-gp56 family major capsid protein
MSTQSADFNFTPKVWKDHIAAYFRKKLVFGAFALTDDTLVGEPGTTINFPYFKKIGPAENPGEDEGLVVDKLSDDSFNTTVSEVGKAVGIKKKAFKTSAARTETIIAEIQKQIGRVHAEKIDGDLVSEIYSVSPFVNYTTGFVTSSGTDKMSVRLINQARVAAFGDRFSESHVMFMHSTQYQDLMNDTTTGFLQANALDPMAMVDGFVGRLLGLAIVVTDNVPVVTVSGHSCPQATIHKPGSYGFLTKQDMELEMDYDILQREWVFTGNQWYAVKSFHAKIASDDLKSAIVTTGSTVYG